MPATIGKCLVTLLPLVIVLIFLSDAYLRYLSFRHRMSAGERKRLWLMLAAWGLCNLVLCHLLFQRCGITAVSYKAVLMLGWIPYLAIFVLVVRQPFWQHVFVFGMSGVWSFSQHNWSALVVVQCFDSSNVPLFLSIHAVLYLLWFSLFLPAERRCFGELLTFPPLFENQMLGRCIAILPLVVLFGPMLLMADAQLVHSWQERVSRIYLPVVFFFLYYYTLTASRRLYEQMRLERSSKQLGAQLSSLKRHQETVLQAQQKLSVLRHDMRHTFRLLYAMLQDRNVVGAMDYIRQQEDSLSETSVRFFCQSPLVNASLSIYLDQAKAAGIPISQQVNLPPNFATLEEDFAVLLANLLENALHASLQQPEGRREISLIVQHNGSQCVLELANRWDRPLPLGENGLPYTSREGHGIGMVSLASFAEKYDAYVDYTQENGWVRISMYWEDRGK